MQTVLQDNATKNPEKQDRRSDRKKDKIPVVYFARIDSSDGLPARIKIGETDDYKGRFKDHSKSKLGSKISFTPLCMVRGTRDDEQRILKIFKPYVLENEAEIFHPVDSLCDYIRWLRDQHFVWLPEEDLKIEHMEIIAPVHWIPSPERMKRPPHQTSLFGDRGNLLFPGRNTTPDDFYTDPVITSAARAAMGGTIDLDPASHAIANREVRATQIFTSCDNGLERKWSGNVWLNPPFSQWESWVPKIIREWKSGRVSQMCILAATRTLTAKYFRPIHENCASIVIFHGRIPFWGERAGSPDDGHAVMYFGGNTDGFKKEFSELGTVYTKGVGQ